MNRIKNKLLLLIAALVLLVLAGAWYGYREFNRKKESVAGMQPAFTVTATEIMKAFETDEQGSLKRYAGKVIEVEASVKTVEKPETGPVIVVLHDSGGSGSIRIEMDSTQRPAALALMAGNPARIRAVCTGYNADDLGLGADVLCNRGIIINQ